MAKQIWVRATQIGWYGDQRRYPLSSGHKRAGDPFLVDEDHFSNAKETRKSGKPGWMERVRAPKVEAAAPQEASSSSGE